MINGKLVPRQIQSYSGLVELALLVDRNITDYQGLMNINLRKDLGKDRDSKRLCPRRLQRNDREVARRVTILLPAVLVRIRGFVAYVVSRGTCKGFCP